MISKTNDLLHSILGSGRSFVYEHEAYSILDTAGFHTPGRSFYTKISEIPDAGVPDMPCDRVVCKLISPEMPHRSEYGGIVFVPNSHDALESTFSSFSRICDENDFTLAGMMVAELLEIDDHVPHQLLFTLKQDPSLGPVIIAGLGGLGTEVWKAGLREKTALFIRSAENVLDRDSTLKALEKTFFYPLITGGTRVSRNPIVQQEVLLSALEALARLALDFSPTSETSMVTIEELEINPVQITGDGQLVPLDSLMWISEKRPAPIHPPQEKIGNLLHPENILLIGASADRMNMGRIILKNLISAEKIEKEKIFLLHPSAEEIDGCRAFASIDDLPGKIDLAVFTIPASERSVEIIERMITEGKTESMILISGGFDETSGGRHLSAKIRTALDDARATGNGPVINGPNCMGIVSGPGGYNTFFLPDYKLSPGGPFGENTAVISQSGAWLVTLLSTLNLHDPRYMITVGNQLDLTITDYLIKLREDEKIDIFILYIEGFKEGDGDRFLKVAGDISSSGKKVLVYKSGRTPAGAQAAASHTAAMATDHDLFTRLLEDAGVYEADTLEDIEDAVKVFTLLGRRQSPGKRAGIISDAGYECSVAGDRLHSMHLSRFSEETIEILSGHLPSGIIDVHNPVDATPAITTEEYGKCVEAILKDENTDCAVISNVAATSTQENLPAGPGHDEDITNPDSHPNTLIRIFRKYDKPVVFCMNEGAIYDPAVRMMEEAGLPVFRKIDRAIKALDLFLEFNRGNRVKS
ncbi:MAG: acetate--CoA ligase family protein [Candidatus Krumholzibacteria bacterium]|nr:acetate--CoA ligase family protein [Candidatus Krumholzibacteria bacterium]